MFKYNPITFVRDVIDLVRNPAGDVTHACKITPENIDQLKTELPQIPTAYLQLGDYVVELDGRPDFCTVAPRDEIEKNYFFSAVIDPSSTLAMPVLRYPVSTK